MKKDRNSTPAAISVQSDRMVTARRAHAASRTKEQVVDRDHAGNQSCKRPSCFKRTIFIGLVGALLCSSVSFGETLPVAHVDAKQSDVRVFVDGLGCNTVAQATFGAVSFAIGVGNTAGSGGGGAGKITVSDLVVQKSPDSCSLPLLLLAASGRPVKVVLTELDKTNKPILTITLAGALISTELKGSDSEDVTEQVSFSFATVTITDSAGLTTGTINR